jgi:hypothetical protein
VKEESKSSPWQESSLYFGEENPNQFLDKIGNLSIRTSSSRNSGLGVSPATMSPRQSIETESLPLQLPPKHLFTCTVGRSFASQARYCLHGSNEIAFLLYHLCISSGIKPEGLSSPPPLTDTYHETYDI